MNLWCWDVLVLVLALVHYYAVRSPSDVAVGWKVLVTWQKMFWKVLVLVHGELVAIVDDLIINGVQK